MKISSRPIALLLLACLGLAARSSAAETSPGPGLLGTSYCGASYVWHNFAESTLDASGFALEANWPVRANLDLTLSFDQWDTDSFFGLRARQQTFLAGLRLSSRRTRGRRGPGSPVSRRTRRSSTGSAQGRNANSPRASP
jgi:hypothetical protein